MKIEIVNTELPRADADAICEKVNRELDGKDWSLEIDDGVPTFYPRTNGIYWNIYLDNMVWRLECESKYVGVVKIEDDIDILYNR